MVAGNRGTAFGRPGDDQQYGSRVRGNLRHLSVDAETLRYLRLTGRSEEQIALVEAYYKDQGLFHTSEPRRRPITRKRWNWIWLRSSPAWPDRSVPRTACC